MDRKDKEQLRVLAFLAPAQERLWILEQLEPGKPTYNIPVAMRIEGDLNVAALEQGLQEILQRHEALRTRFVNDEGQPRQVIEPSPEFSLKRIDLREVPADEREVAASQKLAEESQQPFDLTQAPLLRALLLQMDETDHILLLTMHHIVSDGWSISVLFRELGTLYTAFDRGQPSPLPELSIQYTDFAAWQREWLQSETLDTQWAYWKQQLADLPPLLELPGDRRRPARPTYQGAARSITLSTDLTDALKSLAQREKATLFMVLLAAFDVLLYRYTGQEDIVIGTPIANRNRTEIEGLLGFFVNTLLLRSRLSGETNFQDLLKQVRTTTLDAYSHQDMPFERLVQELNPERDLSHNPLFGVMFKFQNTPSEPLILPGLTVQSIEIESQTSKFDLTLGLEEKGGELIGTIEYSTDLFDGPTIERMLGHYQVLLEGIIAEPASRLGELPLLTEAERHQILVEWNNTQTDYPQDKCIHHLFEEQVERTPDAVAVVFEDQQLTYKELNQKANQLAHYLQKLGVGPEVLVGICLERSIEMVVGILGILKAGGAYVPLDPSYPQQRLAFMVEDAKVSVIVSQSHLESMLPAQHQAHTVYLDTDWNEASGIAHPVNSGTPRNLAYVIYTSGSTGRPKGVQVLHCGVVNFLESMRYQPGLQSDDVLFAVTTLSFDIAVLELFLPLSIGARVVVASSDILADGTRLLAALKTSDATTMQATPATWQLLLAAGWKGSSRPLKILCGGEALLQGMANELLARSLTLWNMYGPTETTIWSTIEKVEVGSGSVSIGHPIANTHIYILDRTMQPVPIGVPGELYIGGVGLARGYRNRPGLTTEKYVPDPFSYRPGSRLYKTGDLVRYLPDGRVEFLGRLDFQVKIRGFRIELGEIEAILNQHPLVLQSVAAVHEYSIGNQHLIAYVVPNAGYHETEGQLQVKELQHEYLAEWQKIFDGVYDEDRDPTFNTSGWVSSYTGLPFSESEMREWVKYTIERITQYRPQRVLEIGCGTGLLLFQIAPHSTGYYGTDFSQTTLLHLQREVSVRGISQVTLSCRTADDFQDIGRGSFDAVILNSVVQYFPSADYLLGVLDKAVNSVKKRGFVFIGDVRNLCLLYMFHAYALFCQASGQMTKAELRQLVHRRVALEKELVIDPAFFYRLPELIPKISDVQIQLKRGSNHNELTQFRYDVFLHVDSKPACPPEDIPFLDWQDNEVTFDRLVRFLEVNEPEIFSVRGIENARLALPSQVVSFLEDDDKSLNNDVWETFLEKGSGQGIDPEDFWELGDKLSYSVDIAWSRGTLNGCYDVVFRKYFREVQQPERIRVSLSRCLTGSKPLEAYTNKPLQDRLIHDVEQRIREYLREKVPQYMIPSKFITLEALPLTPNGKVDRRALPIPDRMGIIFRDDFVAPSTPIEVTLSEIWCDTLNLDKVGLHTNFFELGGDSLIATRVLSRVSDVFQVSLALSVFFENPTILGLVEMINQSKDNYKHYQSIKKVSHDGSKELLSKLDQLTNEEVEAVLTDILKKRSQKT